jgi:hypothetical protein
MTGKAPRLYRKPEIVTDQEGRTHITKASWNHDTMSLHILSHGATGWIKVDDLARLVWGRNTEAFRKAVKRRLPGLKRHMALKYSHLLVVEYNGARGSASAMKIYDPDAAGDVQSMQRMLFDMAARKDGMLTYYEKVTGLSGLQKENGEKAVKD